MILFYRYMVFLKYFYLVYIYLIPSILKLNYKLYKILFCYILFLELIICFIIIKKIFKDFYLILNFNIKFENYVLFYLEIFPIEIIQTYL